jgi:hypothetical protein
VLLKLYDADAEYSADALEGIYDSSRRSASPRAEAATSVTTRPPARRWPPSRARKT